MLFSAAENVSGDAISKIITDLRRDSRHEKVNLCLGYYACDAKQSNGFSVLSDVQLNEAGAPALAVLGDVNYRREVSRLLDTGELPPSVTVQTIGATGALSLIVKSLKEHDLCKSIWISEQSWGNHTEIAKSHDIEPSIYPYRWNATGELDFEAILSSLSAMAAGDLLILQGCCHNPTGIDLSAEQMQAIAALAHQRDAQIIIDFAYLGLAGGIEEDRKILNSLASELSNFFVATSFSKSLGLYEERLGALTYFSHDEVDLELFQHAIKYQIRASYSMPPQQVARRVAEVLSTPKLRQKWYLELAEMRNVMQKRKDVLVASLKSHQLENLILNPTSNGMFLTLSLSTDDISYLREEYGIYILPSGRLSIASLQLNHIPKIVDAILGMLVANGKKVG